MNIASEACDELRPDLNGNVRYEDHIRLLNKERERNFNLERQLKAVKAAYGPPSEKDEKKRAASEAKKEAFKRYKESLPLPPKPPTKAQLQWESNYKGLKEFYEANGHCKVPKDHPQSRFVTAQRSEHKKLRNGEPHNMLPENIQQMNKLEFDWMPQSSPALDWDVRFQQLLDYEKEYGHMKVGVKDQHAPPGLGNWVIVQRKMFKAHRTGQSAKYYKLADEEAAEERIAKLTEAGFVWSLRNRPTREEMERRKQVGEKGEL